MIQGRGRFGFALKSAERQLVFGYIAGQKLQSHEATEFDIFSFIDHTHAAPAELLDDAVVRDGLSNHWSRILRLSTEQVNESRGVDSVSKQSLAKNRHVHHGEFPVRASWPCTVFEIDVASFSVFFKVAATLLIPAYKFL